MAHFAELNDNNEIVRTIVISNDDILDDNGQESEEHGVALATRFTGSPARWIQVSFNGTFRRQYPSYEGFVYNEQFDAIIEPSPFPSWSLDDNGYWQAPVPKPADEEGFVFSWNEETQTWDKIEIPQPIETPEVPVIGE